MAEEQKTLSVWAPAKINLYLHITGRRDDGYHLLDSLMAFADIGDQITITSATAFSFVIDGPYAGAFAAPDRSAEPDQKNLVVRAAQGLAALADKKLDVALCLTKNLPVAAGLGGGSADAAATIRGLLQWWDLRPEAIAGFDEFLLSLGADVPACMAGYPVRVRGIGEEIEPFKNMPALPLLLINPQKPCPTASVFKAFQGVFSEEAKRQGDDFITFLKAQHNDLAQAAAKLVPEIDMALAALQAQKGCRLARMSGSGASCFGLFETDQQAREAAEEILAAHPGWWAKPGMLKA